MLTLPVGALTVTASYAGDVNYNVATATVAQTVAKGTPTVTVTTPLVAVQTGTGFTLTTRVAGATGTAAATGVVTLTAVNAANVSTALGTCTLVAGTCNLAVLSTKLPVGVYRITAAYAGDANFLLASSAVLNFTVTKIVRAVTITTSAASVVYKGTITYTVTIAKVTGTANPSGSVTLTTLINNVVTTLGTCTLSTASTCTVTVPTATIVLPGGSYTITATYAGDVNYETATGTVTQTITKVTTTATVAAVVSGGIGAMKATLTITIGMPGATGTVNIMNGTTLLGTCTLANNAAGTASVCTFVTAVLPRGTYPLTAVYAGNSSINAVTSAILSIKTL